MDKREITIRELEDKRRDDTDARNRLLEGLGELLLQRSGEENHFPENSGETPGGILAEYRGLRKDIADSTETIKTLEEAILKVKNLDAEISSRNEEKSLLEKDFGEACVQLGRAMLLRPGSGDFAGPLKQKEKILLAKIEEQEKKLEELERQEGGVLAWLGKNAQIAVAKTLLSKEKSALERLYRTTGEEFLPVEPGEKLEGEMVLAVEKAGEVKGLLTSLSEEISGLKTERQEITAISSAEGSPSRRIQSLEKQIVRARAEFPAIHLRFGNLAAADGGREALAAILREDDGAVLEKAEVLRSSIAENKLKIEKTRAAISIDNEKTEIEKMKKAIAGQREKISTAEKVIAGHEKQIAEMERHVEELEAFISGGE